MPEKDEEFVELYKVKEIIAENINNMQKRNQKESEKTAYKHLGNICLIFSKKDGEDATIEEKGAIEKFTKFLSFGEIDDLNNFAKSEKMENWINRCEDLNILESFTELICKKRNCNAENTTENDYKNLLHKISEKFKEECEDRGELFRAERIATKINEVLGEETGYPFLDKCTFFEENCYGKERFK